MSERDKHDIGGGLALAQCSMRRGRNRIRMALQNTASAVVARGASMIVMLASVPLTVHYLSRDTYALWMTITSTIGLLSFTDLGIGLGVMNGVAGAPPQERNDVAAKLITCGMFSLSAVALLGMLAFLLTFSFVDWSAALGCRAPQVAVAARLSFAVVVLAFFLVMPLGIVQHVQTGLQVGHRNNLWNSVGSAIALCGIALCAARRAGLPWLVACVSGATVVSLVSNAVTFFLGPGRAWRPRVSNWDSLIARNLIRQGLAFCYLQGVFQLAYSLDNLLVAHALDAGAVTNYSTCARYFSVVTVATTVVALPFWPAFREARASGDQEWLRRAFRSLFVWCLAVASVAATVGCALAPALIPRWSRGTVVPSTALLVGFGVWAVTDTMRIVLSTFLSARGELRIQAFAFSAYAILGSAAKFAVARAIGVSAVPWAGAAILSISFTIPMGIHAITSLRRESETERRGRVGRCHSAQHGAL